MQAAQNQVCLQYFFLLSCKADAIVLAVQNHQAPIDEDSLTQAHQAAYNGGDPSSMDANSMGAAGAMQVR